MADMKIKSIKIEMEDGTVKEVNKGILLGLEPVEDSEDERKLTIALHQINPLEVARVMKESNDSLKQFIVMDVIEKFVGKQKED